MSKDILSIQTGLAGLGHYGGALDGLFGPVTRAAGLDWLDADGQAARTQPAICQGKALHLVTEIVIHCAATRPDWMAGAGVDAKVDEIRQWHKARKWRDIGYHWVIDRDGAIAAGRPVTEIGAGVLGHNRGVIHICLIGGHGSAADDRFSEHFTDNQDEVLRALISSLWSRTPIERVSGHNEWAAKACPGFHVQTWLKRSLT